MKTYYYLMSKVIFTCFFICFSCASDDDGGNDDPQIELDPDLVGIWSGSLSSDFGDSDMVVEFMANGSIRIVSQSNPVYCSIPNFEWYVIGNSVKLQGNESCENFFVDITAPFSTTVLNGNFSAADGSPGTMVLVKQ